MNVWGVFLVLLVGGAAIWIFIRRNYNPIRSIIARFEQISDRKEKEVGEYSFIENADGSGLYDLLSDGAMPEGDF